MKTILQSNLGVVVLSLFIIALQCGCQGPKSSEGPSPFNLPSTNTPTGNGNTGTPSPNPSVPAPIPGSVVNAPGTVLINNGFEFTNGSMILLMLSKEKSVQMKISNNGNCQGGDWEKYETQKLWPVTHLNGLNEISVQFKDLEGLDSICSSSSITHDTLPPDGRLTLEASNTYKVGTDVMVQLKVSETGSGMKQITCKLNGSPVSCVLNQKNEFDIGLQQLSANAYFFQVILEDKLGNTSVQQIGWSMTEPLRAVEQKLSMSENKKADILIVVDNSPSMQVEQKSMAKRMGTFLQQIQSLDWQIGIVTTDARDIKLGDGRLVEMTGSRGTYVLKSSMDASSSQKILGDTLQRPEIGSASEQGIYATYRAIERSLDLSSANRQLFRKDAALATIIISDEDESATGPKNIPENLIQLVNQNWQSQKNFVFHSIIVKPGDQKCLNEQRTVFGSVYANLSQLTGLGTIGGALIGSVCEADYGSQLAGIGKSIQQIHQSINLDCEPADSQLEVLLNGAPYSATYTRTGLRLSFKDPLPAGNYVLKYSCH